jgi:hypothetical protein
MSAGNDKNTKSSVTPDVGAKVGNDSLWRDAWRRLRRNGLANFSMVIIAGFFAMAVYGEVVYWRYNIVDYAASPWFEPVQKVCVKVLMADKLKGKNPYQ